jgi:uncharacterized lipoprotein YddW (UPF0748 family)
MKNICTAFLLLTISGMVAFAQSPKREMRATWLTTVWRNDWPSTTVPAATGSNEAARQSAINTQKNGLIAILDKLQSENINAVFFQIRSMCDAFYPSSYEPWSHFVSTTRGSDPGYDPLAFAIEEAHKRGMELHAWINPYRYSSSSATHGNLPTDYAVANPGWLLDYGSSVKILNPGKPEVVQRIADIVGEVVTNYNVDGIVFDDYFYVEGTTDAMDQAEYNQYNPAGLSRGDWRRANVNKMVKTVYERIQSVKPHVTFGISPAGVAASAPAVAGKYGVPTAPVGSDWQYNGIYSDPLAWLYEGSVDYISPQIYWTIGSVNDYAKLSNWWSQIANRFDKHFYSSHSLSDMSSSVQSPSVLRTYRFQSEDIPGIALSSLERAMLGNSTLRSDNAVQAFGFSEIGNQVDLNRAYDINGAPGSVFFATAKATITGFVNYMNTHQFKDKAIPPAISWKYHPLLHSLGDLSLSGQTLSWTYNGKDVRFAVYAVPNANGNDAHIYSNAAWLQGISYTTQFTLPAGISSATHKIAVSIIDCFGNESGVQVLGESPATPETASLVYPADGATVVMPVVFRWEPVTGADHYVWEIAHDAVFSDLIASRETVEPQFSSALLGNLKNNIPYYWRVKTFIPNASQATSATCSFTFAEAEIPVPQIISPVGESTLQGTSVTVRWQEQASRGFRVELAPSATFPPLTTKTKTPDATTYSTQYDALTSGVYYIRMAARKNSGYTAYSDTVKVTLTEGTGINEIPSQTLKAYVANGNLTIQPACPGPVKIAVYNLAGQLLSVSDYPLQAGINTIPVNTGRLNKGVYLIRLQTERESLTLIGRNARQ